MRDVEESKSLDTNSIPKAPVHAEKMDDQLFTLVKIDELEYRFQDGSDLLAWEGQGRVGTDDNKLALKTEGEYVRHADVLEKAEVQLLYQRLISDFFDAQIGVRHDIKPDPSRTYAVVGINGLAPRRRTAGLTGFMGTRRGFVAPRFLKRQLPVGMTPSNPMHGTANDDKRAKFEAPAADGGKFLEIPSGHHTSCLPRDRRCAAHLRAPHAHIQRRRALDLASGAMCGHAFFHAWPWRTR